MKLDDIFDQYDHVISQLKKNRIKIDRKKNEEALVNFLVHVDNKIGLYHIGRVWVENYLIFQIDYWKSKEVKFGGRFAFRKIFAKNSLDRYMARSDDFNWYMAQRNLGVTFLTHNNKGNLVHNNRNNNLIWCMNNTSMYDGSTICLKCNYQVVCKSVKSKIGL